MNLEKLNTKLLMITIIATCALIAPFNAYAQSLEITGLTYHKARAIIIEAGWTPLKTQADKQHRFGNGPDFWALGYFELESCSGTGLAYCSFQFENTKGESLRITTKGEEYHEEEFLRHATVEHFEIGAP